MKTVKKALITIAAINTTAFIVTLCFLSLSPGVGVGPPLWFIAWGVYTLIVPCLIYIIYFTISELIKFWKE